MNAVVVFCNALTPCSLVLGRSRPKILGFHWIGIRPVKHKKWKPENCQLFQLGTALDFQSPIFGFEVFRKRNFNAIGSWAELFTLRVR